MITLIALHFYFRKGDINSKHTEKIMSIDHVEDTCLKCDICSSLFKTKRQLKKHIESVHEGKKPFKCNICDVSFSQKHNLETHVVSVHEGKKPFKCDKCDSSFTAKKA